MLFEQVAVSIEEIPKTAEVCAQDGRGCKRNELARFDQQGMTGWLNAVRTYDIAAIVNAASRGKCAPRKVKLFRVIRMRRCFKSIMPRQSLLISPPRMPVLAASTSAQYAIIQKSREAAARSSRAS
jgi:hypothetical protein